MHQFTQGLWAGIGLAGAYAVMGLGFSLYHQSSKIFNLAYGVVVVLAADLAISLVGADGNPVLALLVATLAGALLMLFAYMVLFQWLLERRTDLVITITLGVATIGGGLSQAGWGSDALFLPRLFSGNVDMPGGSVPAQGLASLVIAIVVVAGVGFTLQKTMFGRATRAIADDPVGSECVGVGRRSTLMTVCLLSGGLAGLAAALLIPVSGVEPAGGHELMLLAMTGAVVGGLASTWGAVLGGVVLGLVSGVATAMFPEWFDIVQAGLIIAVLLVRPAGLIGGHIERTA